MRFGRFGSLLASVDVDQRALLLALIPVEYPQWDADAEAESLAAIRVIGRGVIRLPRAEGWIGGTIGDSKLVIGLRLLDGLDGRPQVRPVVQRNLMVIVERLQFWT